MANTLAAGNLTFNPLYKEVKIRITRSLVAGEWKPGAAIPSESRLAQQFNVSVGTIRKAIDELVAEKILIRQQGRGTFVGLHDQNRTLFYFFHIVKQDGTREYPVTEMLSFRRAKADTEAAEELRIPRGAAVFRIRNLLSLAGKPVVLDDITIPAMLFQDLTEDIFRNRENTIYNLYQTRYGINVIRTEERLRARSADAASARLLDLAAAAPLLEIRRTAYTYNDVPVELRTSRVNTDEHDYLSALGKGEPK